MRNEVAKNLRELLIKKESDNVCKFDNVVIQRTDVSNY